jgi:hypothetical protein
VYRIAKAGIQTRIIVNIYFSPQQNWLRGRALMLCLYVDFMSCFSVEQQPNSGLDRLVLRFLDLMQLGTQTQKHTHMLTHSK